MTHNTDWHSVNVLDRTKPTHTRHSQGVKIPDKFSLISGVFMCYLWNSLHFKNNAILEFCYLIDNYRICYLGMVIALFIAE